MHQCMRGPTPSSSCQLACVSKANSLGAEVPVRGVVSGVSKELHQTQQWPFQLLRAQSRSGPMAGAAAAVPPLPPAPRISCRWTRGALR